MRSRLGRNSLFYGTLFVLFFIAIYFIFTHRFSDHPTQKPVIDYSWQYIWTDIFHSLRHPLSVLLMQIFIVVFCSRVLGFVFNKLKQPPVIGEVLAGIALGPSLLGYYAPGVSAFLFPPESIINLQFLSQIGLILFMFIIGMELDLGVFRKKIQEALVISHTGIMLSFLAGMVLGLVLYQSFSTPESNAIDFAIFMGVSISITAFPVMARILHEKGYAKKTFGSMMITIAAVDDLTAWCILAVVIAYIKAGTIVGALPTIGLSVLYLAGMFGVVRPFLKKVGEIYITPEILSRAVVGFIFLFLLLSAFVTEVIGIHAFFGAFVAGVVMPPNLQFKKVFSDKIEDVSLVLLLPLFFVFTGLRTQIGLLNSPSLWMTCLVVCGVAIGGKFFGGMLSARFTGHSWKESVMVGVLMNTRGLIELVVLNIGYDLKILSPEIFAIMIIMAISTTLLTSPILDFVEWIYDRQWKKKIQTSTSHDEYYRVLISFGPPRMGVVLLRIAEKLIFGEKSQSTISALHITPDAEINLQDSLLFEKEGFRPVRAEATQLNVKLNTIYKITDDVGTEILRTVDDGKFDLLVLGAARSLFTENIVGGKVGQLIEAVRCNVGVCMDKGLERVENVLAFYTGRQSMLLTDVLERFVKDPAVRLTVINISGEGRDFPLAGPENICHAPLSAINKDFLHSFDLVVLGYDYWTGLYKTKTEWLDECPSLFILKTIAPEN